MCFVCSICTHTGKPNLRRLLLTWQASLLGCKLGSANDKQYLPSKHGNLLSLPRGFLCWLSHPLLQTKEYSLRFLAVGEVNEPIWPRRGKSMNFGISFPVFRVTAPGLQIYTPINVGSCGCCFSVDMTCCGNFQTRGCHSYHSDHYLPFCCCF